MFGTLGVAGESWRLSGEPVTLPAETLGKVSTVELDRPPATGSPWVLSVENKESFYAACDAARAAWSAPLSIRPFAMDVDTFRRYAAFGRPLSRQSRDRLRHLTHPELQALAKTLEERGIGVEQEVIPVSF